jgi:FkbM family methyltransferase
VRRESALGALRDRVSGATSGDTIAIGDLRLKVTDGANAFMQYKDEFVRRNYAFSATRPDPVVIDGGANIGLFSIATLRDHPRARITAFEPDPRVFRLLQHNLAANGGASVTVVNAALGASEGEMEFSPDGQAGGALTVGAGTMRVRVERLSSYLATDVDFLKLNIEGAELDVLNEAAASGRLSRVRAMVIEYHGWPGGDQRLGPLLSLLDAQGFRYLLHDMDEITNPLTKPPFRSPGNRPWFALVYAWQPEGV